MTNEIFIPIRCQECDAPIGAVSYPGRTANCNNIWCFNCAYNFTLINSIIGCKFAQSPSEFLKSFQIKDYLDYLLQAGDPKFTSWSARIRNWYDEQKRNDEQQSEQQRVASEVEVN